MQRTSRTRHASGIPGWGPAPGWGQALPGWSPLLDHGPRSLQVAGSVARWWWPTLVLAAFGVLLAVRGFGWRRALDARTLDGREPGGRGRDRRPDGVAV